ncbi:ATP-binding protein [Prosthecomicrobium sp. N25]|uniref:ATP-binding protein n=1 Tax=Prosthecomicrobium sp. N25 TaxID=3129254 RepID=UPI003076B5E2
MTRFGPLGRFLRTTAFRLSLVYLVVFSVATVFLVAYITRSTSDLLTRQIRDTIDEEIQELDYEFQVGGIRRLLTTIDQKSRSPGASLYLLSDFSGNILAGNIADIPPAILDDASAAARPIRYSRVDGDRAGRHVALVRVMTLDGGFRALVGRDLGEREQFREIFGRAVRAIMIVMVVLAVVTWWFVSRRVLRRIDQVSATSAKIIAGDLSGRLAVTGTGDEFDRLAQSLNGMLERIDDLMRGLKEVSDNIAHDLKTPLTRLRNRVEEALSGPDDPARARAALEATIEESDALIRTFNALLMIARVESGSQQAEMDPVDLAAIAREVAELYEPLADEQGFALSVAADRPAMVVGNRELLAQALSNLIDNALKYGRAEGRAPTVRIAVEESGGTVVASVADNGEGIPAADRTRVLGRFVRLETSRSAPGSGLGLSLVAAITRHHRGTLALADAGPGLRVELRFGTTNS